jgi:hypothetical protein
VEWIHLAHDRATVRLLRTRPSGSTNCGGNSVLTAELSTSPTGFCYRVLLMHPLTFIVRNINPYVAANSRSYFRFRHPSLHLGGTELSLTVVKLHLAV